MFFFWTKNVKSNGYLGQLIAARLCMIQKMFDIFKNRLWKFAGRSVKIAYRKKWLGLTDQVMVDRK